jgi:hypothetical protein
MTELLANQTYRAYNYPHQTAVYWAMYRVARHYDGMTTRMSWAWYLERAFKTAMKIGSPNVGLMDGTVFRELLLALHEEAEANTTMAQWATQLEQAMRTRAEGWAAQTFPYGSEVRHTLTSCRSQVSARELTATDAGGTRQFNFDTTGQEEVYVWLKYFGYDARWRSFNMQDSIESNSFGTAAHDSSGAPGPGGGGMSCCLGGLAGTTAQRQARWTPCWGSCAVCPAGRVSAHSWLFGPLDHSFVVCHFRPLSHHTESI